MKCNFHFLHAFVDKMMKCNFHFLHAFVDFNTSITVKIEVAFILNVSFPQSVFFFFNFSLFIFFFFGMLLLQDVNVLFSPNFLICNRMVNCTKYNMIILKV